MAADGRFILSKRSALRQSTIAFGLPIMIASVSFSRAFAFSPSSSNSAAAPLAAFCLSSSSSVNSLLMSASSGKPGGAASSGAIASGSSDSSPISSSATTGAFAERLTIPPSPNPSILSSLAKESSVASPTVSVCHFSWAATISAMRCFSMPTVACGSICTVMVSPFSHRFFACTSPLSSSRIFTLMFHCSAMLVKQVTSQGATTPKDVPNAPT
mmetsp:Transcript_151801/g.279065  ORF Transcript_151801/g.279065 Transcript_151801/m.279065 type:complete len:214 (-) Transcript_151801:8-649(-)